MTTADDLTAMTTKDFRDAVSLWLYEERATSEQAMMLLNALYAGAIDGVTYTGDRPYSEACETALAEIEAADVGDESWNYSDDCGCLVDTLERIRHGRPKKPMSPITERVFSLALRVGLGDTPDTSQWARAAAQGIEDYLARLAE